MRIYPDESQSNLREARHALCRMKGAVAVDQLKMAFRTFVRNSAFSLFPLSTDELFKEIPGFQEWWQKKSEYLQKDPVCVLFAELRNRMDHKSEKFLDISWGISNSKGINWIGPGKGNILQINPQFGIKEINKSKIEESSPREDVVGLHIEGVVFRNLNDLDVSNLKIKLIKNFEGKNIFPLCESYLDKLEYIVKDFIKKFGRLE